MNVLKKAGALLLTLVLVASLAACTGAPASSVSSAGESASMASSEEVSSEAAPVTLMDREGKEITVPASVNTIISMAPSITETLINLGLAEKIIAVDTYSQGRTGLPEGLPAFDMMTPDTEKIAALKPDLILATGMSLAGGEDPFKAVTDLGTLMSYIPSATSIAEIKEDIAFLGIITKTEARAAEIVTTMEQEIATLTGELKKNDKKIYFEIAPAPSAYSFGTGTFLNEMITLLGGTNILADQESWVSVSEEIVLEKNPDIIFTNVNYTEAPVEEILARKGWDSISAVKNKQVFQVDNDSTSLPNENITKGLREMAVAMGLVA